jgi:hypothetical protein
MKKGYKGIISIYVYTEEYGELGEMRCVEAND